MTSPPAIATVDARYGDGFIRRFSRVGRCRLQSRGGADAPTQINMRKVDGWQTLAVKPSNQPIDLAAWNDTTGATIAPSGREAAFSSR
jgi:hypothetical protein